LATIGVTTGVATPTNSTTPVPPMAQTLPEPSRAMPVLEVVPAEYPFLPQIAEPAGLNSLTPPYPKPFAIHTLPDPSTATALGMFRPPPVKGELELATPLELNSLSELPTSFAVHAFPEPSMATY